MKKIIVCLIVIVMIVLCFSGCRDDKNEVESESVPGTKADVIAESEEGDTNTNDEAGNQKEDEESEAQPQQDEEDQPLIIVPEDEAVGGDDID